MRGRWRKKMLIVEAEQSAAVTESLHQLLRDVDTEEKEASAPNPACPQPAGPAHRAAL